MTEPFRSERCPCGFRWEHCPRRNELEFAGAARAGRGLKPLWAIVAALAAAAPAIAAPCPHGQILRVHLRQCVDIHSRLALAYIKPVSTWREPPAIAPDPPPPERPIPLPELERPAEIPAFVLPPVEWPH
jgi:hypothetical protein